MAGEFGDRPVLDPIALELITDQAGGETFQVTVVYEDDENTIDARKLIRVLTAMATPLEELGLQPVLMQNFVPKDQYSTLLEMRAEALSGEDEE